MSELVHRLLLSARVGVVLVAAAAVAGCSGSTTPSSASSIAPAASVASSGQPSQVASVAPSAVASTPEASASQSAGPSASAAAASASAVPTAIDPCQLIPPDEAGKLAGASFGAGKESTLSGNAKMCVYGSQTKNVFQVIVAVAPDAATAKAEEVAAEADLKSQASQAGQGLTITQLPGFTSDSDAVLMELKPNALGIEAGGIYDLRGTVFFGFNDLALGGKAPSAEAMKAEAMTVLERLP